MENRICKTKDCPTILPEGYKYKYCEHCRNKRVEMAKKAVLSVGGIAVSGVLMVVTKGKVKIDVKK